MASKAHATSLLLTLNLLFFITLSSSWALTPPSCAPTPSPPPPSPSPPPPPPSPPPPSPSSPPPPSPPPPAPSPPPPSPSPPAPSPPSPSPPANCPIDVLKLGVCANLLNSVNVTIGSPPATPCCSLISGLVDLEAAVCLCAAIRANVLGINLNVPLALSLILNDCGKNDSGFQCNI